MRGKSRLLIICVLVFVAMIGSSVLEAEEIDCFKGQDFSENSVKGRIRYISIEYLDTLEDYSKWNLTFKDELIKTLEKKEGDGLYIINISNLQLKGIKNNVKSKGYIISNSMNKQLSESW